MMAKKKSATKVVLWLIAALVILLLIAGGVAKFVFGGGPKAVEVEVADVATRNITQVVTASGKIQPEVEVKISPDVSGEIVELRVKEGARVAKGDLLLRIDPDFYEAQLEQATAGVLQAKATLAQRRADKLNAELELRRQENLYKSDAISEAEYQQAQTAHDVAVAAQEAAGYSVQSSEARLREAREQLAKTVIYSPMLGTVSKLDVELGERVVGTSQFEGTEMLRIAQLEQMELEVDVNENDVVNVALGDSASIEIDAYPEKVFRGVVTEIANSARVIGQGTQEQVTNFPVKIRVMDRHNLGESLSMPRVTASETPPLEAAPNFRPGMSGTVDIYTTTVEDAIAVPIQAVTVRDLNKARRDELMKASRRKDASAEDTVDAAKFQAEDLQKVVFVVTEDTARVRKVETGISDDTHVQIKSGLEGGEKAVIGPYRVVSRSLEDGAKVKIKEDPFRPGGPQDAAAG